MQTKKLTKRLIDDAAYRGDGTSRDIRWDGLPGFGLRVYPSGRKAFVLSYRHLGRKQLMTLGLYGPLTVDMARDLATLHLGKLIHGKNPLDERRAQASAKTWRELGEIYLERHTSKKKSPHSRIADKDYVNNHIIAKWGTRKITELKRVQVADYHAEYGKETPYAANKLLSCIRNMFELGKQWGFVDDRAPNPASRVPPFPEKKRDRWVQPFELPGLIEAVSEHPNLYVRAAIWLYLFTGLRKSELLNLRWRPDVDLDNEYLLLPDTKSGEPQLVPLSKPAVALLRELPRLDGIPWVFPSYRQRKHIQNIWKPWTEIRKQAGIEDVRLHDLRRTVGSWLANNNNDIGLIKHILRHSEIKTTMIYAKFAVDREREALERHAEKLLEAAKVKIE